MIQYKDYAPTQFDPTGVFLEDELDWYVLIERNRDSSVLGNVNFADVLHCLNEEAHGDDFGVYRFGHWAVGWIEVILVRPETKAFSIAEEIEGALAHYPVLNDESYSRALREEADCLWGRLPIKYRIQECRDAGISIFAARRDTFPDGIHVADFVEN